MDLRRRGHADIRPACVLLIFIHCITDVLTLSYFIYQSFKQQLLAKCYLNPKRFCLPGTNVKLSVAQMANSTVKCVSGIQI